MQVMVNIFTNRWIETNIYRRNEGIYELIIESVYNTHANFGDTPCNYSKVNDKDILKA